MDESGQIPYWGEMMEKNPPRKITKYTPPKFRSDLYSSPETPAAKIILSKLHSMGGELPVKSLPSFYLNGLAELQDKAIVEVRNGVVHLSEEYRFIDHARMKHNPGDVHIDISDTHNPPTKVRAGQRYIFRRSQMDRIWKEHCPDVEDGTPVVVTQLPSAPRPGTMGQVHISDARTGEFLGMCSMHSLSTQTDELERTGQVRFVKHNPPKRKVSRHNVNQVLVEALQEVGDLEGLLKRLNKRGIVSDDEVAMGAYIRNALRILKAEFSVPVEMDNPPATEIYRNIIEIRAEKKDGKRYVHKFGKGSSIYGLPDGTILISSRSGKKLWKNFEQGRKR